MNDNELAEVFDDLLKRQSRDMSKRFMTTSSNNIAHIKRVRKTDFCKRCKRCMKHGLLVNHHPNVVRVDSDLRANCKYIALQKWFDFLVEERDYLNDETMADYKGKLKERLTNFYNLYPEGHIPNLQWHFFQLFGEHLQPKSKPIKSTPCKKDVSLVVSEKGVKRYKEMCQAEQRLDPQCFLSFFSNFYVEEYGSDEFIQKPLSMETDIIYDLHMDDLGLVNLELQIMITYADRIKEKFGYYSLPNCFFDQLKKEQKTSIRQIYIAIFLV